MKFEEWLRKQGLSEAFGEVKCVSCERTVREIYEESEDAVEDGEFLISYSEYLYAYEDTDGEWICGDCRHDEFLEPISRIVISGKQLLTLYRHFYFINEDEIEEEDYDMIHELAEELNKAIIWSGMGYRGYYDIDESKLLNWKLLASDVILSGSEDAEELARFDEKLTEFIENRGGIWARVILPTSNIFSAGYYLLLKQKSLEQKDMILLDLLKLILAMKYRDPLRFTITALTGKTSPSEFTEKDRFLAEFAQRILKGEDPEKVRKEIFEKLK